MLRNCGAVLPARGGTFFSHGRIVSAFVDLLDGSKNAGKYDNTSKLTCEEEFMNIGDNSVYLFAGSICNYEIKLIIIILIYFELEVICLLIDDPRLVLGYG